MWWHEISSVTTIVQLIYLITVESGMYTQALIVATENRQRISKPFLVCLRARGQSIHNAASKIPFVALTVGMGQHENNCTRSGIGFVCLPSVYLMSPHLTRYPWTYFSIFANAGDQTLETDQYTGHVMV